jgi:L-threonylcarbamoyladenylate synthase
MDIISKNDINSLATRVKSGDIIVFPTETSYGIGCDATNQQAVDRIFAIKKRDKNKPLLIVVPDVESAKKYLVWNDNIEKLAKNYWPGLLTVIGEYSGNNLARGVVSKNNTVAVRVTDNLWLKEFCQKINCPLVATSANVSGGVPFYDFAEIKNAFSLSLSDNSPDVLVDAGNLPKNPPSTIVDAVGAPIKLIRQGNIIIF